jgi:hypothetical protein
MIKRICLREKYLIERSFNSYSINDFLNNKKLKDDFIRSDSFNNFIMDEAKFDDYYDDLEKDENDEFTEESKEKIVEAEFESKIYSVYGSLKNVIDDGKVVIYRAMNVREDYINYLLEEGKHLGIYWTYDISGADIYAGSNDKVFQGHDNIKIIIESEVEEKYVNWSDTIELNIDLDLGDQEKEIRLFKNTKLKILSITDSKTGEELDISKIKDKIFYA